MKKHLFLLLSLFGMSQHIFGQKIELDHSVQDYLKKSTPQASQFQKYGDLPISANTGRPNISIPFFSIAIKNVNWDIGVNYNAAGFKVTELASCAGLGWNLGGNGGMISARIYQRADVFLENSANDTAYRKSMSVWPTYDPMIDNPCAYGADIGVAEYIDNLKGSPLYLNFLPDVFYLNAGRINEQFILLKDTGSCLPSSDLSIIHTPGAFANDNSYPGSWIVIDELGNRYTFEPKGGSATNFSSAGTDFPDTSFATPSGFPNYNPVYALTQIENTFGERMNFYYTIQCHQYRLPNQDEYRDFTGGGSCNYTTDGFFGPSHRVGGSEVCDPRLDLITTTNGQSVNFHYSDRNDLYGTSKLDSVSLYQETSASDKFIRSFVLYTSYFGSGGVRNLRLRLDSLTELNASASPKEKYIFSYNSEGLPSRISPAQDSSGYYNGETSNTNLVPYYGGNRNYSFQHTKACMLEKLKYPTGGYTLLEYEMKGSGGGLRVKRIKDSLDAATINLKEYSYNTWYITNSSYFHFTKEMMEFEYICVNNYSPKNQIFCPYTATYSESLETLTDSYYGDRTERYSLVTEYYGTNGINGKVQYSYLEPSYFQVGMVGGKEFLTGKAISKKVGNDYVLIKGEGKTYSVQAETGSFFTDPTNTRERRTWGLDFDKERNAYETSATECGGPAGSYCYPARFFQLGIRLLSVPVLTSREDFIDHGPLITRYHYHDNLQKRLSPTRTASKNSKGNCQIDFYKYPCDYSWGGGTLSTDTITTGIYNMGLKHVMVPVEHYVALYDSSCNYDYRIVSAEFISYRKEFPAPYTLYSLDLTSPTASFAGTSQGVGSGTPFFMDPKYKPRVWFTKYNSKGSLLEQRKVHDIKQVYLRNPYNDVPLAVISNADSSSVAYTSFELDDNSGWTFSTYPYTAYIYTALSVTGKNSYNMTGGNITKTVPSGTYIVSYWGNGGSASVNSAGPSKTGRATTYWTYYEHEVTGTSITVSGSNYIDELRIYPKGAQMTTYTYSPEMLMTGQCDNNNRLTFYEYDSFSRLKIVRDEEGKIINRLDYKYLAGNTEW